MSCTVRALRLNLTRWFGSEHCFTSWITLGSCDERATLRIVILMTTINEETTNTRSTNLISL